MLTELQSVKEAVSALASRVAAIDKHLRRVYQIPKPARPSRPSLGASELPVDREAVLRRFDKLRALYTSVGPAGADAALKEMDEKDLRNIVRELGLPNSRKSSVQKLRELVGQRLRESSLLGSGTELRGPEATAREAASDIQSTQQADSAKVAFDPDVPVSDALTNRDDG